MPSLKYKHHIHESYQQVLDWDPLRIRLIEDRLLIRDVPDESEENGIVIPETIERGVGKNGQYRIGIVVATGPGNKFIEVGTEGQGREMRVKRRRIMGICSHCHGAGELVVDHEYNMSCICGEGRIQTTIPCTCKVGDRVIYERRKEAEVFIDGVRYGLVYEEQAIVGILGREVPA